MRIKEKRGQAAVFIIIGLIILIAAGAVFLIQKEAIKPIEGEVEKQPSLAGQIELRNYVESCLQKSVLQGLEIMRLQGGYIVIPENVRTLTVKDKENKVVKKANGSIRVVIDPSGEGNEVPYWLNKESLAVPSISLMEFQLGKYVSQELGNCINDFKPFKDQNFNITYGSISPKVRMENAITTKIIFPIKVKKENIAFDISEFIFTVPINMKLIAGMASDITGFESVFSFFEDHTKSLISLYSGLDSERLPPFSQAVTNFDCSSVSWSKADVKQKLKAILSRNVPFLKIGNTGFERIVDPNPVSQGVYDSFIYELFDETYPTVSINFSYRPEWEFIDYDINPSLGDSLMPSSVRQTIPLVSTICVFEYDYKYTVGYPVLVEIDDGKSAKIDAETGTYLDDGSYKLQYVLDSYLCGNQKRECTGRPSIGLDFSSLAEGLNASLSPETLFCEEEQRVSSNISISIFDADKSEKIGDVDVFYYCGSYQNDCFIGRTGENGSLNAKFPLCINGIIYMQKKGYADLRAQLTVYDEPARALSYRLDNLKEVSIRAKKIDLASYVKNYHETGNLGINGSIAELNQHEFVSISANGPQLIMYNYPDPAGRKVEVSPGTYDLTIALNGKAEIENAEINGKNIGGLKGNYLFGLANMKWNVDKNDIKGNVTFFALSNYNASNLNPGAFDDIDDPIIDANGSLSAELLYKCEKTVNETTGLRNCDDSKCEFVAADGNLKDDFKDNSAACEKAYDVKISKEEYEPFIKPVFG